MATFGMDATKPYLASGKVLRLGESAGRVTCIFVSSQPKKLRMVQNIGPGPFGEFDFCDNDRQ
jgi:hypothetical protein